MTSKHCWALDSIKQSLFKSWSINVCGVSLYIFRYLASGRRHIFELLRFRQHYKYWRDQHMIFWCKEMNASWYVVSWAVQLIPRHPCMCLCNQGSQTDELTWGSVWLASEASSRQPHIFNRWLQVKRAVQSGTLFLGTFQLWASFGNKKHRSSISRNYSF